ncbi:ABC transporter ATP-binding protein [Anaerovorax odorimutans]|uniref:ABC transporter ATP-binding protein n=1 Tax=Anaerovorax odorimutans TaxID=109327 RepID=UPI000417041C|nr:ABC transporter ATP-binding protein [Anaerovorax odorimutans]
MTEKENSIKNSIEVKNLNKFFNSFNLKNINFSLPQGCIMGFIGENGAGKTTTIKLLLNQLKKDSGNITLLGYDNIKEDKKAKQDIGVVLDESYFHENLKPAHISKIMSKIYSNWDNSLFKDYLNKFNIPDNKIFKKLSKGMKMKLSLATALSHHPKLLILDEATSGLDPIIRNEILDIFLEFIQDENHSIFISSHITSDLEKICDYITFIHDGEIIFTESKDTLLWDYGLLLCGNDDFNKINQEDIIGKRKNSFGYEILVKNKKIMEKKYKQFTIDTVNLEDIMMFYVKGEKSLC